MSRRILSLWFPGMEADRLLRQGGGSYDTPFAVVAERGNSQVLYSLSPQARAAGLRQGQSLRDAQAICPGLMTRMHDPLAEAAFLSGLRRWAGKFSPWVAEDPPSALLIDLTGCAHLFGGEVSLLDQLERDCADLGLTIRAGLADTVGAAWALARHAGRPPSLARSGDAIDQEAPATRARATRRKHWERGGPAPQPGPQGAGRVQRIAGPGRTRQALAGLPVTGLRLDAQVTAELARLGLRRIEDLAGQPRAAVARRFGRHLVQRLDQALGLEPEPISPAGPDQSFAFRITLPEPIGLEADVLAAVDRLLPPLCDKLRRKGRGARRVRLQCQHSDHSSSWAEIGLARPSHDPERIRPLLQMKLPQIEAGFGIDLVRLEAHVTEPLAPSQHRGHAEAAADAVVRRGANDTALDDLLGRIGARMGLEALTRRHPADSHIPEKATLTMAAAWSDPPEGWPGPTTLRPLLLWPPEPVTAADTAPAHNARLPGRSGQRPPPRFRWRNRVLDCDAVTGPERIAPEWWLDDPAWRSGVRDYWRVTCTTGDRLWLYYAHGGEISPGWFCQGSFA